MCRIILFGNEKGGAGKTTTAMHFIISLLTLGFKVSVLDLDIRQKSLSRYIENRLKTTKDLAIELQIPDLLELNIQKDPKTELSFTQSDVKSLENLIHETRKQKIDFLVIDTPGNDNLISRHAHYLSDIVITPINDSFIDVDLLGKIDPKDFTKAIPGIYSAMFWEEKKRRAMFLKKEVQWFVVRNRLPSIDVINKANIGVALEALSKRLGFKVAPGFGDRVIFKELFLDGLTLLDVKKVDKIKLNSSLVAARQELRDFISCLNIQEIKKEKSFIVQDR